MNQPIAALLAADYVVVPLSPDLYSLQSLRNLGPTLCKWRDGWTSRLKHKPSDDLPLPPGAMCPAGYITPGQPPGNVLSRHFRLTLAELEPTTRALTTVLLPLFHARVAREEAELPQNGTQVGIRFQ